MLTRLPKRLNTHATFGVCSPSGFIAELGKLDLANQYLTQRGFKVIEGKHARGRHAYFSGTDSERLDDLNQLIDNPQVDAVIASRGGYGLTRVLEQIDYAKWADHQKPIIGFSDVTALNLALLAKAQFVSFQGPMLTPDMGHSNLSPYLNSVFESVLMSSMFQSEALPLFSENSKARQQDELLEALKRPIEGILWGGNLSLLAHLTGTPYMPNIAEGILFIEEVNEEPYKVERMMMQLYHAGILKQQKAIVMCQFNQCVPTERSAYHYTMQDVVAYFKSKLNIPILEDFPFGHVRDKYTLPLGALARLTLLDDAHYQLQFSKYNQ
ncbi:MAG: LD-carboxypeptidase [Betaproteobacteria bacterium]|nr:LD-carboxypeptidase [Betaproteobacteria bacterium]